MEPCDEVVSDLPKFSYSYSVDSIRLLSSLQSDRQKQVTKAMKARNAVTRARATKTIANISRVPNKP